ncbi:MULTISPECIES: galactose/glucose ABC transporter substrate-binding protein MglB [Fusobacterium]|jgi:methyl-galactoside transport system substrate-binding protein|uniref:D-galactose/methyl-galactoside binding periplasmic protein MglB n=3 Tax=Fusobacterium TaxID=848 RepID=A0A7G9GWT6_9FUSO|nr:MULTISPECIES: galactose/glucose ABC transporter substrate-binding protein MglB [Fusobacterium]QNM15268.1 galactose/glucose ABC transporter substrate-binding protein MglB [Fusobacterium hominis]
MKKTGLFIGALLLAAGLSGCGDKPADKAANATPDQANATAQQTGDQKKLRIGFTAYKYDDNFIALFRKVVHEEADKMKDKVDLIMNDSQNAQQVQNDQIDAMLSKGVDGLAINLVDPAAGETVMTKIKAEDVPVVFYNKKPAKAVLDAYDKAYYVGIDPNAQGIAQGELIMKAWKANPNLDLNKDGVIQYVMLKGEPGHPDAEARTIYSVKTLNDNGIKTEELALDAAMWDTALAKDKMDAWLSGPNGDKIEVVICNNDSMAFGAIEALRAAGKQLPVFGVDALPEAIVKIKEGEMAGTVLNDANGQGVGTWDMIVNLAAGKNPTDGTDFVLENKELLIPSIGIDKDNVDQFNK